MPRWCNSYAGVYAGRVNLLRTLTFLGACAVAAAQGEPHWVTVWTASVQGPYPTGNSLAQPNLKFAFPVPATGAKDQTFRLIVLPDIWGRQMRLRFSNVFGTKPVTFDGVYVGLHWSGGAVVAGTNRPVLFSQKASVTIPAGESVWSDAIALPFAAASETQLAGRKLAVSFHVAGESGPMTWHAKALATSYVSRPDAGSQGEHEDESAFPFTTTSWYFLDAVDMNAPGTAGVVVALGDSITDGTGSTLNGEDRWPTALARRVHAAYGNRLAVVNAGIGGNRVAGPEEYSVQKPFSGGPSAGQRLERDVLSLSNVKAVIWLEGINDLSASVNTPVETIEAAMKDAVKRMRGRIQGVRVIGATVTSAKGASGGHGSAEEDQKRRALNDFIRNSGTFDGVADFDGATADTETGGLRAEFVPDSTTGGAGDRLHPNRAGYQAMAMSVDLKLLAPAAKR